MKKSSSKRVKGKDCEGRRPKRPFLLPLRGRNFSWSFLLAALLFLFIIAGLNSGGAHFLDL